MTTQEEELVVSKPVAASQAAGEHVRMTAAPEVPAAGTVHVRIEPVSGWVAIKLREMWEYRELLGFLVWRDLKVRYKQTALGAAWAILQPVFNMLVFTLFFGRLAKMPSDGIPYPVFAYAALVPWSFFAQCLTHSADSLVSSANLVRKIYFPRLAIPVAAVIGHVVDFALAFSVMLGMMAWYKVTPSWRMIYLPGFLLLALVAALGTGLWLSTLNVKYRDVKHTLPFLVQFWMFATPIVYPSSLIPEQWRVLYGLNPMVGVVEGFRWALLGTQTSPGPMLLVSIAATLVLLVTGLYYFRRMETTFADTV